MFFYRQKEIIVYILQFWRYPQPKNTEPLRKFQGFTLRSSSCLTEGSSDNLETFGIFRWRVSVLKPLGSRNP